MAKEASKNVTDCPECNAGIHLRKAPFLGQIVTCRQCRAELEVVSRQPLALADSPAEMVDSGRSRRWPEERTARRPRGRGDDGDW